MKAVLVAMLTAASLSLSLAAQTAREPDDWELVARLCGKLVRAESIPGKNGAIAQSEKIQPLKNVQLKAYERPYNATCCANAGVAAKTTSNNSGTFDFKGLAPGRYWLAAIVDNREYSLPVLIQKTRDQQPVCSEMSYVVGDAGKLTLRVRPVN